MSSFSPKAVRFETDTFWVDVADGRTIGVPYAWFPRLLMATPEQRADYELSPLGIHWDSLDEDILVEALFQGLGDRSRRSVAAA